MTPLKTHILIVDDHPIVLRGLRMLLNAQADCEVVESATDGDEAVRRALVSDIHLAILDISMPRKTGLQAAREITQRCPGVRVLMLSMHDNEQFLFEAIRAGASGYVLKSSVDRDLVEACRAAMRGEPFLYPEGIRALMHEHLERVRTGDIQRDLLTPREEEILKLMTAIEASKKSVAAHEKDVTELRAHVAEEEAATQLKVDEIQVKIDAEKVERNQLAAKVRPEVLKRYSTIRIRRGLAVVPVVRGACQGCHMKIPPQLFNQLQRGNSVEACPTCYRIIYWDELMRDKTLDRGEGEPSPA